MTSGFLAAVWAGEHQIGERASSPIGGWGEVSGTLRVERSMSEAYNESVRLYRMAKNTEGPNRAFNVEAKRLAVHDDYHNCLRLLTTYCRTHDTALVACAIWGGRKRLGVKFQGKNVTVGVVKSGDIEVGITREIRNAYELKRYLENTMGFTTSNLNETLFQNAYEQLRKIEKDTEMKIDPDETKK